MLLLPPQEGHLLPFLPIQIANVNRSIQDYMNYTDIINAQTINGLIPADKYCVPDWCTFSPKPPPPIPSPVPLPPPPAGPYPHCAPRSDAAPTTAATAATAAAVSRNSPEHHDDRDDDRASTSSHYARSGAEQQMKRRLTDDPPACPRAPTREDILRATKVKRHRNAHLETTTPTAGGGETVTRDERTRALEAPPRTW